MVWVDGPGNSVHIQAEASGPPHVVARSAHGGLIGPVVATDRWLVYPEYRMNAGNEDIGGWWLTAVDVTSLKSVELASGPPGTALAANLPLADAKGDEVVWDQATSTGARRLILRSLTTGTSTELAIPPSVSPVRPRFFGNGVAFLDNAGDPGRAHENWITRHGAVDYFDIETGVLRIISPAADSWFLTSDGDVLAWLVQGNSTKEAVMVLQSVADSPHQVASADPGPLGLARNWVTTFADGASKIVAYPLGQARRPVDLSPVPADASTAACGRAFYFVRAGGQIMRLFLPD